MRHRGRDWTTAVLSWQLKTSSVWFYLSNGCRTWNPAALTAGFPQFLALETRYFGPLSLWMIGRGLRLRRADVAGLTADIQKTTFSDDCRHRSRSS